MHCLRWEPTDVEDQLLPHLQHGLADEEAAIHRGDEDKCATHGDENEENDSYQL